MASNSDEFAKTAKPEEKPDDDDDQLDITWVENNASFHNINHFDSITEKANVTTVVHSSNNNGGIQNNSSCISIEMNDNETEARLASSTNAQISNSNSWHSCVSNASLTILPFSPEF